MNGERLGVFVAVLASSIVVGCTTMPSGTQEVAPAASVKLYSSSPAKENEYQLIKRLWVESWRSSFFVPEYPTEAEGIAALQREAAKLGANGLTTVACYKDDKGQFPLSWGKGPVFICYGNAIRVRNEAR